MEVQRRVVVQNHSNEDAMVGAVRFRGYLLARLTTAGMIFNKGGEALVACVELLAEIRDDD
jgi:hypothetical protein